MAIITLQEYKDFFGITSPKNDTRISAIIAAIESWINFYLFGDSGATTVTTKTYTDEVYNGAGNNFIRLRGKPIQSITNVKIGYDTAQSQTFLGTDFIFDDDQAMLYFNPSSTTAGLPGYFPQGDRNIAVTYVAGWDDADVPAMIKWTVAQIVQIKIARTDGNPLLTSETLGDYKWVIGYADDQAVLSGPMNDLKQSLDMLKPIKYVF